MKGLHMRSAAVCLILFVAASTAATVEWPSVTPFHHSYRIVQAAMPVIKATIEGQDGRPQYLFICRSGDDDSVPDVNYSGNLDCRLIPYSEGEVETTMLIETHNERTPAWYSRGRMLANELYGKCAAYPEYGAMRHFSVRGMQITLSYGDIKFNAERANGQPSLNSYTLTVDVEPDKSAATDIAKASGYMDPSRQNYDCSKIVKGIDMPDTHQPWPKDQ
jgi:hypothetical protein